jgi:hypothetical protein
VTPHFVTKTRCIVTVNYCTTFSIWNASTRGATWDLKQTIRFCCGNIRLSIAVLCRSIVRCVVTRRRSKQGKCYINLNNDCLDNSWKKFEKKYSYLGPFCPTGKMHFFFSLQKETRFIFVSYVKCSVMRTTEKNWIWLLKNQIILIKIWLPWTV